MPADIAPSPITAIALPGSPANLFATAKPSAAEIDAVGELDDKGRPLEAGGLFLQGLLVNLSNPKAVVFISALTPQFIDPTRPQWPQFMIIGLTMSAVDSIVMSAYALLAGSLRGWMHGTAAKTAQNRFFGGIFLRPRRACLTGFGA